MNYAEQRLLDEQLEIVKRIELEPARLRTLHTAFRDTEGAKRIAAQVMNEMLVEAARCERKCWDQVAVIAGFEDLIDAELQGYSLRIDWLIGEIHLCKLAEPPSDSP